MNDDELRRALDAYASAAPANDPRPGLRARLARRRRLRAVSGAAAAAVLLAGTAVVTFDRDPSGPDVVVAAGETEPATATPTPDEPAPSPSAEPPSPFASASTSPSPPPSPSPAPSSYHAPPPGPPGEPVSATAQGEHGLEVRATLDPGNPGTGREAVLTIEATDDDGSIHVEAVAWGDGTQESYARPAMCAPSPPVGTPRPPQPDTLRAQERHAWRLAGSYRVTVRLRSELACHEKPPPESATVVLTAHVRADLAVSNGPAPPPRPDFQPYAADDGGARSYTVGTYLHDRDGYVGTAVIDWGDGVTDTIHNDYACDDGKGTHYPARGALSADATHTYRQAGTYTVTIRYASSGCDGRDAQPAAPGSATVTVS